MALLMGALGVLLIIMIAVVLILRISAGSVISGRRVPAAVENYGYDGERQNLNLEGVGALRIDGAWNVSVERGDVPDLSVDVPQRWAGSARVYVDGGELVLDNGEGFRMRGRRGKGRHDACEARIILPSLGRLSLNGMGDVNFSGFDEEHLDIDMDGMGQLTGRNSRAGTLEVSMDGVGKVNLKDVPAGDVHVYLDGMGDVKVNVDGGTLEGSLDGMGSVVYYGRVRENKMRIDGLGKVRAGN